MNSSAKLTAVTLLAAAALGAAVGTQGCTVTSGTDSDTDGGTSSSSGSSGNPSGDSGTQPTTDSGTDSGTPTNTCAGNKQSADNGFGPNCQPCLEQKCCTQLKGCFDIAKDDAGTTLDCNDYVDCTDACQKKPAGEIAACQDDCDSLAAAGVVKAYDDIVTCGQTSCATECAQ